MSSLEYSSIKNLKRPRALLKELQKLGRIFEGYEEILYSVEINKKTGIEELIETRIPLKKLDKIPKKVVGKITKKKNQPKRKSPVSSKLKKDLKI